MRSLANRIHAHCVTPKCCRHVLSISSGDLLTDCGDLVADGCRCACNQWLYWRWSTAFVRVALINLPLFVGAPRPHCRQRWFEQRRIWSNSFLQDGREGPSRDHHATSGLKVKIV